MSFLFKKVANKLRRNMAAYLFLVLEFTLGTSFLIFSRNATLSIQKLQKYYNTNYTNTTISLFNWNSSSTGGAAITPADAREIQRQFPNSQLRYRVLVQPAFVHGMEVSMIPVLYCDLPEFETNEKIALIGKNACALLKNQRLEDTDKNYLLQGDTLTVGGQGFKLRPLPERLQGAEITLTPLQREGFFSLDNAVLVPIWSEGIFIPSDCQALAEWDTEGKPEADLKLSALQEMLYNEHGGELRYGAEYPLRTFKNDVSDGLRLQTIAGRLGGLMFLELLIGFTGLMLLFLKKREKELAICLAVGAKRRVLAAELLCEIGAICAVGASFGAAVGNVLTARFKTPGFSAQIQPHWMAVVPALAAAAAVTILSALPMLHRIYTAQPDQILRGE